MRNVPCGSEVANDALEIVLGAGLQVAILAICVGIFVYPRSSRSSTIVDAATPTSITGASFGPSGSPRPPGTRGSDPDAGETSSRDPGRRAAQRALLDGGNPRPFQKAKSAG